jgi:uncharacterized membrane protein YjgN (DUF898 family)
MDGFKREASEDIALPKAFEFKGNGKEFFRIWIVNIALSILTLGIYSAWAKVRTNRYMYANTYLNGSNFEYNADPKRILIGRMVVISIYALFVLFSQQLMLLKVAFGIALIAFIAMPWLVRQAVSFKLRNTSYRHVPFKYKGKMSEFYAFFLIHSLLNIFTVFLIFPYSYIQFKKLILNHAYYGQGKFYFKGKTREAYGIYIRLFFWNLLLLLGLLFLGVLVYSTFISLFEALSIPIDIEKVKTMFNPEVLTLMISFIILLTYLAIIAWQKAFSDAYFSNFVRNKTTLDKAHFKGEISPLSLAYIGLTNILVIIFSLGLLYPWAKIRYLRYKLEHTYFICQEYNQFESEGYETGSTLGEEMVDFFDIDIGL